VNPAAATRQQSAATPAATQSAATPAATPAVSQSYRCLGWRQTHGCDPNGRRERGSYEGGCDTNIDAGRSGFCECQGLTDGKPHRVRPSSCDHMPFTCTTECARASFYTCDGWRQTGGCQPDGPREESLDQTCDQVVSPGVSGYCECAGGARRVARPAGCSSNDVAESCSAVCARGESLYAMLGVPEGAAEAAVKQAFRKSSLKLHPDKQRTAESKETAAARFTEVRAAYDVLSDPDARILYDMHGYAAAQQKASKEREPGVDVEQTVSLAEAYVGIEKSTTTISRRVVCKGCAASAGGQEPKNAARCQKCSECPNEVKPVNVQMGNMIFQQHQEVRSEERCRQQNYPLEFTVRRGIADGEKITFARAGEQRPGRIPGDVTLKLKVGNKAEASISDSAGTRTVVNMVRKGRADLQVEVHVSLREALLGFTRTLTHLDKHTVTIERRAAITPPSTVLRIPGEGLVRTDEDGAVTSTGALLVMVHVDFPSSLTSEQKVWAANALPP